MALTARDRELLKRCLHREPGSWNEFVDRFLGLFYHIVRHTAHLRSFPLNAQDTEDLVAQILMEIVEDDYAVLRQFRGQSALPTYLTVLARRVCVQELSRRMPRRKAETNNHHVEPVDDGPSNERAETLAEITRLLRKLPDRDQAVVRLFYLEGRSYEEISKELKVPVNTIGPILSRAKKKMREEENGRGD